MSMARVPRLSHPQPFPAGELPSRANADPRLFKIAPRTPRRIISMPRPKGMFRRIVLAEGFDEELGFQRTHEIVPVAPTEQFTAGPKPIFIVFELHQHYQHFQVFGRCYPSRDTASRGKLVVVLTRCTSPWKTKPAISNCSRRDGT